MKILFLTTALSLFSLFIYSQDFLKAGEIRNENFNHVLYSPPLKVIMGATRPIDFNNDYIQDGTIMLTENSCNSLIDRTCQERYYRTEYIEKNAGTQLSLQWVGATNFSPDVLKEYSPGETIKNDSSFLGIQNTCYLMYYRNVSPSFVYFDDNDSTYIAYRIISEQPDTLYGWMRLRNINTREIDIYEIGCESYKFTDTIINSNNLKDINTDIIITNPVENNFRIYQSFHFAIHGVRLIDLNGVILKVFDDNSEEYNISEFKPGIYIISFLHGSNMIRKRIIKI